MNQEVVPSNAGAEVNRSDESSRPPRSYRPPQNEDDYQQTPTEPVGTRRLEGNWWDGSDLLGAIGLSITSIAMVLFAGGFVDVLADGSEGSIVIGTLATAAIAFALAMTIARVTGLPRYPTINLLGLAVVANVMIHVVSDGGDSDILGIPPALLESAILSGLPFGVAWLYVIRKHGRSLAVLGFTKTTGASAYGKAVGAWVLAYVGIIIWGLLTTEVNALSPPDNTTATLEIAGGSIALAWVLAGLWGPAAEEIFFRGFLLGGLRNRAGQWPAILISSAVFALFHIHPGLYVPTFLLGAAFGWVYLKTRSIWPAIFIHATHNTLVLVLVWQDFE